MGRSPVAVLFDAEGNEVLVSSDGVRALVVRDPEQLEVFKAILVEARKTNWYLAQLIDQDLEDSDVEDK